MSPEEFLLGARVKNCDKTLYYFGILKNRVGEHKHFICRNEKDVPKCAIYVTSGLASKKEIIDIAQTLLQKFLREQFTLKVGSVAHYVDNDKTHTSIVLDVGPEECFCLFLTSSPTWNRFSREASKEEIGLCGFPCGQKQTYLAPVFRARNHFVLSTIVFPEHRIQELKQEFANLKAYRNQ